MQKIRTILFSLLCVCSLAANAAYGYFFTVPNDDGKNIKYYTNDDGDFCVTVAEDNYSGILNIPSTIEYEGNTYTVTSIGSEAFKGCSTLTGVSIPATVTYIGYSAFVNCSSLSSLRFEDGEQTLQITYEDRGRYLDGRAMFYYCPANVYIGRPLHYYTHSSLGYGPFYKCPIRSVSIGGYMTEVPENLFTGCSRNTNVTLANSVIKIGASAFSSNTSLTSLDLGSVETIGNSAFSGCSALKLVELPTTITKMGTHVFGYCGLTTLSIPDNITTIPNYAFRANTSLETVYLPSTLTDINDMAFSDCYGLRNIYCLAVNPPSLNLDPTQSSTNRVFDHVDLSYISLYVPEESIEKYATTEIWQDFKSIQAYASISTITSDPNMTDSTIYNLQGVIVGKSVENLPAGMYIQNGHKFIVWQ